MPSVQVKEFPQGLYDELKAYAETQHRSMSQQLIVAAEQMMNRVSAADADSLPHQHSSTPEEERLWRTSKRKAIFARADASIERARSNGSWKDGGPDSVGMIRSDREGNDRHGGGPSCGTEAMRS